MNTLISVVAKEATINKHLFIRLLMIKVPPGTLISFYLLSYSYLKWFNFILTGSKFLYATIFEMRKVDGWVQYIMFHLWYERLMDNKLNIETQAMREWVELDDLVTYNRLESTPYQALDKLFEFNELGLDSNFVDFGCGTGRVAFYIHNRFNIPVTGIELNQLTYHDLINNYHSYLAANPQVDFSKEMNSYLENSKSAAELSDLQQKPEKSGKRKIKQAKQKHSTIAPLNFVQEYAEKYEIQADQNVFYFLNPFTVSIFVEVVRNIEQSLYHNPRPAELILYYPMYEYQSFMERKTVFNREGSIRLNMLEDEFEKFIVYRYQPVF